MKFNISIFNDETLTHAETVTILTANVKNGLLAGEIEVAKHISLELHFGNIKNSSDLTEAAYFVLDNQAEMFLDCEVFEKDVNVVIDKFLAEMSKMTGKSVEKQMLSAVAI